MLTNRRTRYAYPFAAALVASSATVVAPSAEAQQWSALDRVPAPYNTVAVDSSMTMATAPGGAWAPAGFNRLSRAQQILTGLGTGSEENGAMYLFRDRFVWGGFSYSGSIEAHIKDGSITLPHLGRAPNTIVRPDWQDLVTSYVTTRTMIDTLTADYCLTTGKHAYNCMEQRLPGGATGPACITPGCTQDRPVVEDLSQNPITGLALPVLVNPPGYSATSTIYPTGWPEFTFPCDKMNPAGYPDSPTLTPLPVGCPRIGPSVAYDPACPVVNIPYELAHELGNGFYQWPRFVDLDGDGTVDVPVNTVAQDICRPLRDAYDKIQLKLNACLNTPPTLVPAFNCNPSQLSGSICSGGSPFLGGTINPINGGPITIPPTCVCDSAQPGCISGGGNDDCGNPLYFPARQQVGICRTHDAARQPARTLDRVPGDDNILRDPNIHTPSANPDLFCRSNVATFVTDAEGAHPLGLAAMSPANAQFYFADFGVPQNNVITVGAGLANGTVIQSIIRGIAPPGVATIDGDAGGAVDAMRARFARDLNRSLRGTYAAAAPALTQYQDRAAFMVMEVPGVATNTHLDYFGRPLRMEWWEMDPTNGTPVRQLFSTDEAARAGLPAAAMTLNGTRPYLGGSGVWRSGMNKVITVPANTLDRDGDGTPDVHPPIRWGFANGGEGSRPVIVGAPLDAPEGRNSSQFAAWKKNPVIYRRDRVAYVLSNGYLHAFRVGRVTAASTNGVYASTIGDVQSGFTYDDNPASPGMGSEIFRYRALFVEAGGNASSQLVGGRQLYTYNDLVQQPLIDRGQIFVRDVQLTKTVPYTFGTVLVFTQGAGGRGVAAVNVSNPLNPVPMWDAPLLAPGALALAAPTIYQWPDPAGGDPIPAVILVGGALTPPPPASPAIDFIYAYRVTDGSLISRAALPRLGANQRAWPNTPVCLDRGGGGRTDRCYVLASDGTLAMLRVNEGTGAFFGTTNITPAGVVGSGRVFNSGLTAYFTASNQVALVFGSGDTSRIERGEPTANAVFKLIHQETSSTNTTILNNTCRPGLALQDGVFAVGPGEMIVSPPTVGKGTVSFSTFLPGATGCQEGQSLLYAFDFETCRDVIAPPTVLTKPSVGRVVGSGIPTSPVLLRRTGKLLVHTSATPAAVAPVAVRTRGGAFETVRPVFFRLRGSAQ